MKRFSILFSAILLAGIPAFADVFTLQTGDRGWATSTGGFNTVAGNPSPILNYFAGIDFSNNAGAELRNWFQFDLSTITGTVVSASLQIDTGTPIFYQTSSETFQLTSLPSTFNLSNPGNSFSGLGTGSVYATQDYNASSASTLTITLDSAAIADLNNDLSVGTFGLSGRVTTLQQTAPGTADEALFTYGGGDPTNVELLVTTTTAAPEPASVFLFMAGLGALQMLRRNRQ